MSISSTKRAQFYSCFYALNVLVAILTFVVPFGYVFRGIFCSCSAMQTFTSVCELPVCEVVICHLNDQVGCD